MPPMHPSGLDPPAAAALQGSIHRCFPELLGKIEDDHEGNQRVVRYEFYLQ